MQVKSLEKNVNIHFGEDTIDEDDKNVDYWTEEKNKLAIKTLKLYLKYLNSFNY